VRTTWKRHKRLRKYLQNPLPKIILTSKPNVKVRQGSVNQSIEFLREIEKNPNFGSNIQFNEINGTMDIIITNSSDSSSFFNYVYDLLINYNQNPLIS
jgi:hypothetical protein